MNTSLNELAIVTDEKGALGMYERTLRLFVLLLVCMSLPGCAMQRQNQSEQDAAEFEIALERGRQVDRALVRLMDAIHPDAWKEFPPPGRKRVNPEAPIAAPTPCPVERPGDYFMFTLSTMSVPGYREFDDVESRGKAANDLEAFLNSDGFVVSREVLLGDELIRGLSDDMVVIASFGHKGVVDLTVETTCSSDWRDFSLKWDRFIWLYFKRFDEETLQTH